MTAKKSLAALLALSTSLYAMGAQAASFTVEDGDTATTSQILGPDENEIGIVEEGGTIHITGDNQYGIDSTSPGATITNDGDIIMDGANSYGIVAGNPDHTVINNGTITVNASTGGIGMDSFVDHNTLTNNGDIALGDSGYGIIVGGDFNIGTNNGNITATSDANIGMYAGFGEHVTITNNDTITLQDNSTAMLVDGFEGQATNNDTITVGADSFGMVSTGNDTAITNNGYITATGDSTTGIHVNGIDTTVRNNGFITVLDDSAGMVSQYDTNTLDNYGTITIGDTSAGMFANSTSENTVTNYGDIIGNGTTGGGVGMYEGGALNLMVNEGSITMGIDSNGMRSDGDDALIMNAEAGTIHMTDDDSIGMYVRGENTSTINYGHIITDGENSSAIRGDGNSLSLLNSGTITLNNDDSAGIYSDDHGNSLANTGTINVNGDASTGMGTSSSEQYVINAGTINIAGEDSAAMYSAAENVYLINYSNITVTGDNSDAIHSTDHQNFLANGGNILVTGNSNGISGSGTTYYANAGTIITEGTGNAIYANGHESLIINAGHLRSESGIAISVNGNDNTVTLLKGSYIEGDIAFDGEDNILTYDLQNIGHGGGLIHTTGDITGDFTTLFEGSAGLPKGAQVVQQDNTVAVITPDNFASTSQVITQTIGYTGDILNQRQQLALLGDTRSANDGTQYAAATSTMNDATDPKGWAGRDNKVVWAEAFGSYQMRPDSSDSAESQARAAGGLAGVDLPESDSGIRSGVYVGGFAGNVDIGNNTTFRSIDSSGALAGGYIGTSFSGTYVSGQLAAGYSTNDSDRNTGIDTATASYNSYFVSPSLTVMHPIPASGMTLVPSATLRYSAAFDESYNESGSVANQNVDSRMTNALEARAMMEAHYDAQKVWSGLLKPTLRAGIKGQTTIGSNKVDVNTLGSNISFDPKGADNYVDGILGANFTYATPSGPQLYLDGEGNFGLNKGGPGGNSGGTGRIGAKWKL